ncbi:MAG TPA: transposase [Oculatellaceae cyanobacterium]
MDSTVKFAKKGQTRRLGNEVKGRKISLVVDEVGFPVDLRPDSASRHDLYAEKLVEKCPKGSVIVADRGYDANWFRRKLGKKV